MTFHSVLASPDLMSCLAPFLVVTELPLCALLVVSKEVRTCYLDAVREHGLLAVHVRLKPGSAMTYTLHHRRFEAVEDYMDDEGVMKERAIAPRLPLSWSVHACTPEVDCLAAHDVPCCDLWRHTAILLEELRRWPSLERLRLVPERMLDDWPTSMCYLDDGSSCVHDWKNLLFDMKLARSSSDLSACVRPLVPLLKQLREATAQLQKSCHAIGVAKLGRVAH